MYLLRHAPYLARMMDASPLKKNAAVQKDFMETFANVSSAWKTIRFALVEYILMVIFCHY